MVGWDGRHRCNCPPSVGGPDLGYLAYHVAALLVSGEITGEPGETFTVEGLNDGEPYEIGEDSVVILGPPFTFDESNIDDFDF